MTLPIQPTERPLRGVLFADLADSSRLLRELGDHAAQEVVECALAFARAAVESASGQVVKTIGDELFCLFPDADSALAGAFGIQVATASARENGQLPPRLAYRIGLVHGPVGLSGEQVFGDTVYLAKRVSTAAKADQVLTTTATVGSLCKLASESFRPVEILRLKGRVEEVELVEALWSTDVTLQEPDSQPVKSACDLGELHLTFAGQKVVVNAATPSVTIGRGLGCDVLVQDTGVSRLHAKIATERGGFRLTDLSSNGTLVHSEGRPSRTVKRSSTALNLTGTLQLGSHPGAPVVAFAVCQPDS